jgi:hypothetical protein
VAPSATSFVSGTSGSLVAKAGGFVVRGDSTGAWPYFGLNNPPTAWARVTLQNGAVEDSSEPFNYRKDAFGVVWLVGRLISGPDTTTVFTLPAGFRPSQTCAFPQVGNGWDMTVLTINTDGTVNYNSQSQGTGTGTASNIRTAVSFIAA